MSKVPLKALGTEIANNEKSVCPLPSILCSQCHFPGALAIAKMLLAVQGERTTPEELSVSLIPKDGDG